MDEHGLPIVGAGVDYTRVQPLDHKNTLVFLNKFITHTAQFLNRFSLVCEERLSELSMRIQRLDISLNILEAKLNSIPGLEGVQANTQYEPPAAVASAGATTTSGGGSAAPSIQQASGGGPPPPNQPPPPGGDTAAASEPIPPPQPTQEAAQSGRKKAKDDPRYAKYFKMKRLGVNPLQIAMEMKRHGLNPDILENEDADLPEEGGGAPPPIAGFNKGGGDSSDSSSSSSEDSDASFESD